MKTLLLQYQKEITKSVPASVMSYPQDIAAQAETQSAVFQKATASLSLQKGPGMLIQLNCARILAPWSFTAPHIGWV